MTRIRLLAWMTALVALLVPPSLTVHAMAPVGQAVSLDCPDHAPPPEPCPAKGTAKHAAGDCCAQMSGTVALLPSAAALDAPILFSSAAPARARSLAGRTYSRDPPPPRV